jgi:hypothetical protein
MESDSPQARIEHGIAELRGAYPRITTCLSALHNWHEDDGERHSLWLDIRWPQHQSIVSGPARGTVEAAVQAALDEAVRVLEQSHA